MEDSFDFARAVAAHRAWVDRLKACAANPACGMDLDKAADYEGCTLGAWLREREQTLAALPSFVRLGTIHQLFHTVAGDVICLLEAQKKDIASWLIEGQLRELSEEIVEQIERVKQEASH